MQHLVMLMFENELPESLSARKLVVETAKHNVLTAYDAKEGLGLLRRFPNVDVILVHDNLLAKNPELVAEAKALAPHAPIILATPSANKLDHGVDYMVNSHNPQELLKVLAEDLKVRIDN